MSTLEPLPDYIPFDETELLLGYQRRWISDPAIVKIAEKSRRTGLTWAEAAKAVLTASAKKTANGGNHFYVGSNKEMAREFIDAVAMWAKAFDKAASEIKEEMLEDEDKDILTFVVNFASGFKVQALSSKPSNLRGMQGDVTIDEAAFHEQLAEVLKAALALTMWGSRVSLISTHNGVDNLFNQLILDSRAGKKRYSVHKIDLDDACREGLYKRICQVKGKTWSQEAEDQWKEDLINDTASPEDAQEEYYCIPKQGGGVYLSRTLLESRADVAPVVRFHGDQAFNNLPKFRRREFIHDWLTANIKPLLNNLDEKDHHALGQDFARSGDLTVITPLAIKPNLQRQSVFSVELKNVPFDQQEQILFCVLHGLPNLRGAALDARGNGQQLAESARDEFGSSTIDEVMLTQSWYAEHMPRMKQALEDDEYRIIKDREQLEDMRAIQVVKGIPKIPDGNTSNDKKQQRHGDAAVAYCLAYAASFLEGYQYGYQPAQRADNNSDLNEQRDIKTTHGFGGIRGSVL